jgi:glutamine synthetase
MFADGVMFDGSSIAGWKAINESDMVLMPDTGTAHMDPFFAQSTMAIFCDILDPITGEAYNRDPRMTAKKAEAYVKSGGFGDTIYFGPEAGILHVRRRPLLADPYNTGFILDSSELPSNMGTEYETGNLGHRPRTKGGYFPVPPVDSCQDIRSEMLTVMAKWASDGREAPPRSGCRPARTRHEVQHADDLRRQHADLQVRCAPGCPCLRQVGNLHAEAGLRRQRHRHALPPVHLERRRAGLCRQPVCGSFRNLPVLHRRHLKHAKALNAFTNPSTNSYKRLVPGYEAPVLLAYSARNRSASCRIPYTASPKAKRVEVRFPDPMANPYLCFSAMLMAGLDGIKNKIHPGDAMDKNLYDLPAEELADIPTVCGSLREALEAWRGHEFLKAGGVFDDDQIEAYIELKMEEEQRYEMTPHPVEFDMYYSV